MWIWRKWQIRSCVGVISMIFDFNPWQLDVDIDLTKQLYKEVDYSTDKTANVYKYISGNDFYRDFMIKYYSNLVNR